MFIKKSCFQGNSGVTLISSVVADGVIYCKIRIESVTYVQNKKFDLNNNEYYLLLAAGREAGKIFQENNQYLNLIHIDTENFELFE